LYEEFSAVVVLQEQMRVVDPEWREMLTRLRHGNVQKKDIDLLKGMIITNKQANTTKNEAALRKHCKVTKGQVFICHTEDQVKDCELNLAEEYGLALHSSERTLGGQKRNTKQDLPESITMAVGAQVMVVQNIDTDLNLANGARGTIVGIV
ncbi:hypothetical protein F5050DRAFT_1542319, partial [Lentinula boryana]